MTNPNEEWYAVIWPDHAVCLKGRRTVADWMMANSYPSLQQHIDNFKAVSPGWVVPKWLADGPQAERDFLCEWLESPEETPIGQAPHVGLGKLAARSVDLYRVSPPKV